MENTDKSLIDAHCKGDPTAFGELVRRHGGSVLGYLIRISGSRAEAEDLFQETFRRVHEKAHTLESGQFRPWLFRIATNVAMDGIRRRRRRIVALNQPSDCSRAASGVLNRMAVGDNHSEPSYEAIRAEQKTRVRQAIESLPKKQRATLVLAYYQQLSYREVASVMGCSIGAVKTQMFRALKTLAQKLPDVSEQDI